jgi:spore coat polysaccharide biosynthesis protein SpsF
VARTGVFIQVRLGSTRLPGKALLPLAGMPVVSHVMRAVAQVPAEVHALLTDAASAEGLSSPAKQVGYRLFVGSPDDVLARFCAACREYGVDRVVRVTGDNPLTSGSLAVQILALHARRNADLSHYLDIPWGMGVEAVEAAALYAAEREAVDPAEREHITTYHYRHREKFLIVEEQPPVDAAMPAGRVTVDTPEDFTRVQRLFADLYEGRPLEHDRVVRWLAAERSGSGAR